MSTVHVVFRRTFGMLIRSFPALVSAAVFLAVAGGFFTYALMRGDGGATPVAALWAVAASPILPVLATLFTARLVADERTSGRMDLLLTAPVLERDLVLGKFAGAWAMTCVTILLYLLVPLAVLPFFAPALAPHLSLGLFLPASGALALQALLWCSCGLLASVCCRPSAVAAFAAMFLMVILPQAAFHVALAWFPVLRARLSELPTSAHLVDFATGLIRLSTLTFYVFLAGFSLFAASKVLANYRFVGRAARRVRLSTACVTALAFIFACFAIAFAVRLDFSVEIPLHDVSARASARTRQILAETSGRPVQVTCFLARKAPEFRAVARLLRGLEATARGVAGVELKTKYVDPRWELGEAARLVRAGVPEGSLEFRRGPRSVRVPVASLFGPAAAGAATVMETGVFVGETVCASALQRLTLPTQRETVYWTTGHGESDFASYDSVYGMSDIARELQQDGYHLKTLDLARSPSVPGDCAVLVIAGARDPFSRTETQRLEGYLRAGGRLLVLAGTSPNAGVGASLADWGVRQTSCTAVSTRTLNGADVLVTSFADHAVTRPLVGSTVLFESPFVLEPSGAAANRTGAAGMGAAADRTEFAALAQTDAEAWGESEPSVRPWTFNRTTERRGPLVLAAALERGGGASHDLALRPTRIVVIGDATFVMNGALARRANANRDFFLNSLAWLAGLDAQTEVRTPGNVVVTGLARGEWIRFGVWACTLPSGLVLLLGVILLVHRGRRA